MEHGFIEDIVDPRQQDHLLLLALPLDRWATRSVLQQISKMLIDPGNLGWIFMVEQ
jgi:hypothetical protein